MKTEPKIVIIGGPTASGKTSRSLAMAKEKNGVIVSADSRMVYSRLDIGTGKPTWEYKKLAASPWLEPKRFWRAKPIYEIDSIEHYGLDLVEPETPFSLSDWLTMARTAIVEIQAQGKTPIVVGGTGLYLKAIRDGYVPPPKDEKLRSAIEQLTDVEIRDELQKVDSATLEREWHNRRRLVRALEVFRLTGETISKARIGVAPISELVTIDLPHEELYARIDQRVDERLAEGMIEEVDGLLKAGISAEWLLSLGLEYRAITEWLRAGSANKDELSARLKKEIRGYARRQQTYLRTQLGVNKEVPA